MLFDSAVLLLLRGSLLQLVVDSSYTSRHFCK